MKFQSNSFDFASQKLLKNKSPKRDRGYSAPTLRFFEATSKLGKTFSTRLRSHPGKPYSV